MNRTKRAWSKTVGERPHRVRVYEVAGGSMLYRSVFVRGNENRRSLGHRDKARALRQARELVRQLESHEAGVASGSVTLAMLVRLYTGSPAFAMKKERTQVADNRTLARVVAFFGPNRRVNSLSESDADRYVQARSVGDPRIERIRHGKATRTRTVCADLIALSTALNWGARHREPNGDRLLGENPLALYKRPTEKNPRRPVMTHETYQRLLNAAPSIHPLLTLALIVAEGTGRRLSAWRQLRWDDIDFGTNNILWRAENDKKGYEQSVPMLSSVREALERARHERLAFGTVWVFCLAKTSAGPVSRHTLDAWLRKAYEKTKAERGTGSLWHALRRKWATERKHLPVVDIAAAGGWRDVQTVLECYMREDAATIKQVIEGAVRVS